MQFQSISLVACLLMLSGAVSAHGPSVYRDIKVEIVADDGRIFPLHNLYRAETHNTYRAYLEAIYKENYGIRVRNLSGRRLGLVIAVDGRNIISGDQSQLQSSERMYILDAYSTATYEGWRTSNRKIHRFFFTDAGNSYAGTWGDYSAMGVISVAVFNEKKPYRHYREKKKTGRQGKRAPAAADRAESELAYEDAAGQPGTGFGDERYSHARTVHFDPIRTAAVKYFYKYEWRQTLCNRGLIDCGQRQPNRFWPKQEDRYGFAPYPPGFF